MKKLTVITPAICRPDLHKQVLPPVVSILKECVEELHWVVNVDPVPKELPDGMRAFTPDETREGLLSILEGVSSQIFLPEKPCFFAAIKYMASQVIADAPVLYLEDDWSLIDSATFRKEAVAEKAPWAFHTYSIHGIKNLNPGIWGSELFRFYFIDAFSKRDKPIDPEHLLTSTASPKQEKIVRTGRLFADAGKTWRRSKTEFNDAELLKWDKFSEENSAITYRHWPAWGKKD